jgi:hypothetical protein
MNCVCCLDACGLPRLAGQGLLWVSGLDRGPLDSLRSAFGAAIGEMGPTTDVDPWSTSFTVRGLRGESLLGTASDEDVFDLRIH